MPKTPIQHFVLTGPHSFSDPNINFETSFFSISCEVFYRAWKTKKIIQIGILVFLPRPPAETNFFGKIGGLLFWVGKFLWNLRTPRIIFHVPFLLMFFGSFSL